MANPMNEPQQDKEKKQDKGQIGQEDKPTFIASTLDMAKNNIGDTIAYVILIVGLMFSFFHSFYGGLPVGFIMGLYFSKKVTELSNQFRDFISHEGIFRGFIVVASLAALVISAPGLCLGVFAGSLARPFFGKSISPSE